MDTSSDIAPQLSRRLAALEEKLDSTLQRLDRLEQASALAVTSSKSALEMLNELQARTGVLERGELVKRMLKGLSDTSRIYPKTRSVVFVGREYAGDNIKYAFLAFCEQAKALDVAVHYIPGSATEYEQMTKAGLACLPWRLQDWTSAEVRLLLEAGVVVLCNLLCPTNEHEGLIHALLQGAKAVQLWHGIPYKQIGLECLYPPGAFGPRTAEVLAASGPYDVFVGSGAALHREWAQRFTFREYAPIGYPRTDVLMRTPAGHDLINVDEDALSLASAAKAEGKPVVLYVPTFRDQKLGVWFADAGIERFADHCAARGWLFLVNMHPFEHAWMENAKNVYTNIRFVRAHTDIYPILHYASVLVTDYSSLALDYLMLDRPVVFYRPDHEEYARRDRALVAAHGDYICGPVTADIESLNAAADEAVAAANEATRDDHAAVRHALRTRIYDHLDGKAGERLARTVAGRL